MNLKEYLDMTGFTVYRFHKICNTSPDTKISKVSLMRFVNGYKPSKRVAQKLEKVTGGVITIKAMTSGKLKTLKGQYAKRKPLPRVCVKCAASFEDKRAMQLCPPCVQGLYHAVKTLKDKNDKT